MRLERIKLPSSLGKFEGKGIQVGYISILLTLVARMLYIVASGLIARSLGPEGFGLFSIAWTVAGIGIIFANMGILHTSLRYGVSGRALWREGYLRTILLSSCIMALAIFIFADDIAVGFFGASKAAPAIKALAPIIPATVISSLLAAGLRTEGRTIAGLSIVSIGLCLGPCIGIVALVLIGYTTPTSFAVAWSIGLIPVLLIALLKSNRSGMALEKPSIHEKITFSLKSLGLHVSGTINMWIDRLMVGALGTVYQLGLYQSASMLSMIPMMLVTSVAASYEARLAQTNDKKIRSTLFAEVQALQIHLVTAGAVIGAATAQSWLGLIFGAEMGAAGLCLAFLLIGQLVRAWCGPVTMLLHMSGKPGIALVIGVVSVFTNILLNFLLIMEYGELGAAFATALTTSTMAVASLLIASRMGLVDLMWRQLAVAAIALMAALLATGCYLVFFKVSLFSDILAVLCVFLIYGAVLTWHPHRLPKDPVADNVRCRVLALVRKPTQRY